MLTEPLEDDVYSMVAGPSQTPLEASTAPLSDNDFMFIQVNTRLDPLAINYVSLPLDLSILGPALGHLQPRILLEKPDFFLGQRPPTATVHICKEH